MRGELPTLRRCCFCLPLRYGLLFWSYFKLMNSILFLYPTVLSLAACITYEVDIGTLVVMAITQILNDAEVILNIMFIIAAHRKNFRILNICCYYMLVTTGAFALLWTLVVIETVGAMGASVFVYWYKFFTAMTFGFMYIVVQVYVILLTRSEAAKLRSNCQFNFTNLGAEAECALEMRRDDCTPDAEQPEAVQLKE